MERYKNLNGNSGIEAYEIAPGSITVQFKDRHTYLYDNNRPGAAVLENMQRLAQQGAGLNSYIRTYVKKSYVRKWYS
jgi:hypothetical protein